MKVLIKEMLSHLTFLLCAMGYCKNRDFGAPAAKHLYLLFSCCSLGDFALFFDFEYNTVSSLFVPNQEYC